VAAFFDAEYTIEPKGRRSNNMTQIAPETLVAIAHPWQCDVMGHMNTRHIIAVFDDAGFAIFERLGFPTTATGKVQHGWADVRLEVDLRHEIMAGTVLRIRSSIIRLGRTSFTHAHDLVSGGDTRHATAVVTTVRFDLVARRAIPLPGAFTEAARPWLRG
jgi:acyl-CoA thioester hydrolase